MVVTEGGVPVEQQEMEVLLVRQADSQVAANDLDGLAMSGRLR